MYRGPLKFQPIYKERLWGGEKLKTSLNKQYSANGIGESWEISAVKGDVSQVIGGPYSGKNLDVLIEDFGPELLGFSVVNRFGSDFPILIKYIDAELDLSIQVHPNDELAAQRHQSFGKNEMWFIMDHDPNANLILGFQKDCSKKSYQKALEEKKLSTLLNYTPVNKGDAFMIETGTMHAIGAGILLAEIQQTSDITYRVYDFDRRDKDGNTRELHTDLALDAIDYSAKTNYKKSYNRLPNTSNELIHNKYFKTNYLHVNQWMEIKLSDRDSFSIYMCVEGEAVLRTEEGKLGMTKGETLMIPACCEQLELVSSGAELLEIFI
ncbi:MAG: mannose-6-phosphate isomerase [Flavobacteriaceae bacterium]|nr:mannose-6-phosphate isomerase [Flavobacteriaceae bacterium]